MKVKDLITALQKYDPELEVLTLGFDMGGYDAVYTTDVEVGFKELPPALVGDQVRLYVGGADEQEAHNG